MLIKSYHRHFLRGGSFWEVCGSLSRTGPGKTEFKPNELLWRNAVSSHHAFRTRGSYLLSSGLSLFGSTEQNLIFCPQGQEIVGGIEPHKFHKCIHRSLRSCKNKMCVGNFMSWKPSNPWNWLTEPLAFDRSQVNPLMPSGAFNICCPRDAVSRTANVERTARH